MSGWGPISPTLNINLMSFIANEIEFTSYDAVQHGVSLGESYTV